ncbi:MAG: hypothetical protein ACOYBQ_09280 [Fluviibacter sp.]
MISEEFLKARKEKKLADMDRLRKHREVLAKIRGGYSEELLLAAFKRIDVWKKNQTCNVYYIEEWTKVLNNLNLYEDVVLNPKNHHLRQNTPFRMKGL